MSVLQLGDSLSNGYSPVIGGVPAMPWGGWVAFANGWPYTRYSKTGRTSSEILSELAPSIEGDYLLGCLTAGANDLARKEWSEKSTAAAIYQLWDRMASHCEHVVGLRLPSWYFSMFGVPKHVAARTGAVNRILEDVSGHFGGMLVCTDDLVGPRYVRPDLVHFTSIGELAISSKATLLLKNSGVNAVNPIALGLGNPDARLHVTDLIEFGHGAVKQKIRQSVKTALCHW